MVTNSDIIRVVRGGQDLNKNINGGYEMTDSEKLDLLIKEVAGIKLTLENETNRNIMALAEGHLDLTRKLDAALEIENEKEMMKIRLNILESEVKKIKEKIGA